MRNFFVIRDVDFCRIPEVKKCFDVAQNNPHHCYNVGEHMLQSAMYAASDSSPNDIEVAAMMLHDIGKVVSKTTDEEGTDHFYGHAKESAKMAKEILDRIGIFSEKEKKDIIFLIKYHMFNFNKNNIENFKKDVPKELLQSLARIKTYDILAQSMYMRGEKIAKVEQFVKLIE